MLIKSFLFTGIICMIAQIIKDNTKLTSGHITSIFVVLGAILSFFNIYDKLIKTFGAGANVVIMSFGNSLYKAGIEYGLLNQLKNVSIGITLSIIMGFVVTIIFKVKD